MASEEMEEDREERGGGDDDVGAGTGAAVGRAPGDRTARVERAAGRPGSPALCCVVSRQGP